MVNARIQTKEYTNRSLHWTQQYAVCNRAVNPLLDETTPKKAMKDIELGDLLPGRVVQDNLVHRWAVIVGRVITKFLESFKSLRDVVVHHIPHMYSSEMTAKSESVSNFCPKHL
jgi:hypothetical protein